MAFYLISITIRDQLKGKKEIAGIKEDPEKDIDRAYQKFEYQYRKHYGESQVLSFNCYGLARRSPEVMTYLNNRLKDDFKFEIPDVDIKYVPPDRGRSRKESMGRKFGGKKE